MPYRCLVFDWDGTLSDSIGLIVEAMRQSILDMGLDFPGKERCKHVIGLGLNEAMLSLYPEFTRQEVDALIRRYRGNYRDMSEVNPALFPGIRELLEQLHREGYLLAIATGKSRRGLDHSLQSSKISHLIHATCCSEETLSKPHPMMLEKIMNSLNIRNHETLMVGDTEFDLEMANNAGVTCVAVDYGAHQVEHLLQFKPVKTFKDLNELPGWLSNQ